LRRYRIRFPACERQWQGRRRSIYPDEVYCLRWQRTELLKAPIDCGLTARPVVLAKTYGPESHTPAEE